MTDGNGELGTLLTIGRLDDIELNYPKPPDISWHEHLLRVDEIEKHGLANDTGFLLGYLAGLGVTLDELLALYDPERSSVCAPAVGERE